MATVSLIMRQSRMHLLNSISKTTQSHKCSYNVICFTLKATEIRMAKLRVCIVYSGSRRKPLQSFANICCTAPAAVLSRDLCDVTGKQLHGPSRRQSAPPIHRESSCLHSGANGHYMHHKLRHNRILQPAYTAFYTFRTVKVNHPCNRPWRPIHRGSHIF
jgi:hypothetical protein